jgi:hypothetical protein
MSSSSLLGKAHIALAPMNGVVYFFVWFYATDVNRISNGANTKTYSSIRIDFQYFVRPTKGRLKGLLPTSCSRPGLAHFVGSLTHQSK